MDAPKPFWYFAGIALLIIALPVAYRIANPNQSVSLAGEGVSITLGQVQSTITAAQSTVTEAEQQAAQQRTEITQLEQQLSADQKQIAELIAEIQKSPQAPAALKSYAALQAKRVPAQIPKVSTVSPELFVRAQSQLDSAKNLAARLNPPKK